MLIHSIALALFHDGKNSYNQIIRRQIPSDKTYILKVESIIVYLWEFDLSCFEKDRVCPELYSDHIPMLTKYLNSISISSDDYETIKKGILHNQDRDNEQIIKATNQYLRLVKQLTVQPDGQSSIFRYKLLPKTKSDEELMKGSISSTENSMLIDWMGDENLSIDLRKSCAIESRSRALGERIFNNIDQLSIESGKVICQHLFGFGNAWMVLSR